MGLYMGRNNKNLFNIHIQNPKVNFSNFDLIVAPEHDQIIGSNVLSTFGALHYITKQEVESSNNFFSKLLKTSSKLIMTSSTLENLFFNHLKCALLKSS